MVVDVDATDHALTTRGADPVVDLADDLADMHQEQTFLTRTGSVGDMSGEELDIAVGEDPEAKPLAESRAAPVLRSP
ncbi:MULTISPECIES: hypothetical protein [Streptomyces]|uniref:hypothetical protein n=1 Tax=Streptomyces TaxID=1883 RepID=UPI0012FF3EFA|nr:MULTISPECIES: hypothetical protein [Streptomyces]MDX2747108.1 hypothetical protein [Streptomyces sp. NRRL_B-2557]MDX3060981.1 hypothetical protein [Streptomyces sp. ND04-05B]WRY80184.1 hypothetical protein OG388_02650 [Streptomyces clavifer]